MSNSVLVSEGFSLFYQYADSISLLMLSAVGLMIIFGMMGVINMAHGELMFIGAYTTSVVFMQAHPCSWRSQPELWRPVHLASCLNV